MRRKRMYMYLGAAAAVFSMTVPAMAAETEEIAAESESDVTVSFQEVILEADGEEIVIANDTDRRIEAAKVEEESGGEGACTVILSAEDGQHTFENVKPEEWKEPKLTDDQGFLYIQYTDAEGNSREAVETGEAKAPEEEMTVWALTDVNMREEASSGSEVVAVVGLGDECKVLELLPGWYQVEYKGEEGYINHRFLSDDQADAEAAAQQEQAALDAAEVAQQSSYSYSYSKSGSGKKSNKSSNSGKKKEECLTNGLLN